jgi:hypothetical protein
MNYSKFGFNGYGKCPIAVFESRCPWSGTFTLSSPVVSIRFADAKQLRSEMSHFYYALILIIWHECRHFLLGHRTALNEFVHFSRRS